MDKIKLWIYQIILHKYLPINYLIKVWSSIEGYRTQICAVLWILIYELGRSRIGPFADAELTKKLLEYFGGIASVTLIDKFKRVQPYLEEGIDFATKNKSGGQG